MERLEDRALCTTRFIVPIGESADGVITFNTMRDVLTRGGLVAGDIIQIEPGSSPGAVGAGESISGPPVANLTIQGNPSVPLTELPEFDINSPFTVDSGHDGLVLKHVRLGLVGTGNVSGGGKLAFNANASIIGSSIDVESNPTAAITFTGVRDVITGTTVFNHSGANTLDVTTPAGGSNHLITNNVFVNDRDLGAVILYSNGSTATVTDRIAGNTFVGRSAGGVTAFIDVESAVSGLTIQNNSITGLGSFGIAQEAGQNVQILGNKIHLTLGGIGVLASKSIPNSNLTGAIANNDIDTAGFGAGIKVDAGSGVSTFQFRVEGNDLHGNLIGVLIAGSTGTLGDVDLGGGTQGSLGGNNFRSFTDQANAMHGAIICQTMPALGIVHVQRNLFAAGPASSRAFDPNGNLDLTNRLSANASFVQALYARFLGRTGNTASAADAGVFVNRLDSSMLTRAQVATAIARSTESLGRLVDSVFQAVLGRSPATAARNSKIKLLQQGSTLEDLTRMLLVSAEYKLKSGSDAAYVHALYQSLLARTPTNAQVSASLNIVTKKGRGALANQILASTEFRTKAVQQMFGFNQAPILTLNWHLPNFLHRTSAPAAAEVNPFVNSTKDLLSIEIAIAQSTEFFANG